MGVASSVQWLRGRASQDSESPDAEQDGSGLPDAARLAIAIGALAAIVLGAGLGARRRGGAQVLAETATGTVAAAKSKVKRRKPRSLVRYYGIGLLINALERDTTRKAVLAVLKLAQKRA